MPARRAARGGTHTPASLARTAPLLETALPDLPPGGGARLLTYTQALIAGLQPMSDPSPAVPDALHALITGLTVPTGRNVQNESRCM